MEYIALSDGILYWNKVYTLAYILLCSFQKAYTDCGRMVLDPTNIRDATPFFMMCCFSFVWKNVWFRAAPKEKGLLKGIHLPHCVPKHGYEC